MTAKETKVRQENRLAASDYLKKATDNYDQMLLAFNSENWNAAATLAVQCAISSADAVCVRHRGVRSISQDHLDVCELVSLIDMEGRRRSQNSFVRSLPVRTWSSTKAAAQGVPMPMKWSK